MSLSPRLSSASLSVRTQAGQEVTPRLGRKPGLVFASPGRCAHLQLWPCSGCFHNWDSLPSSSLHHPHLCLVLLCPVPDELGRAHTTTPFPAVALCKDVFDFCCFLSSVNSFLCLQAADPMLLLLCFHQF